MEAKTIAIDLAKNVFELAVADSAGKVLERKRLNRGQLQRYFHNHGPARIVMEACGTSHFWGRWFKELGMAVSLLPPHYVKAYVRRNKTDRADATALLEAARATDIIPVQVKSIEQQALQSMHRVRSAWRSTLMPGRCAGLREGRHSPASRDVRGKRSVGCENCDCRIERNAKARDVQILSLV